MHKAKFTLTGLSLFALSACQLMIETERDGNGAIADNWRIVGTTRRGPCNNLPG